MVIGDDYKNINELEPILAGFNYEIFNINIDDALRDKKIDKEIKWSHSVTRSIIFSFEKCLQYDFDYILISADDELYLNNKLITFIDYIEKYNSPDFIFSLAYYIHKHIIFPRSYNKIDLMSNFPLSKNVIESGTMYKLTNKKFINEIINFRKERWNYIQTKIDEKLFKFDVEPEDVELWDFLLPKFKTKIYTSLLIPIVTIDHFSERSLLKFIS
jgi:hypothetical protein